MEKRSIHTSYKECTVKVPFKEYSTITQGFMRFLMQKIMDGDTIDLPANMGYMHIRGKKIIPRIDERGNLINLAPDWVTTKKLWSENPEAKAKKTLIYHFNEHTAGIRYRIEWNNGMCGVVNKILYSFQPSRENKRKAWKSIINGKEYYVKPRYHTNEHK